MSESDPSSISTLRARAKAERRETILRAAASLFAERGFTRVSLEDIGGASGVSGPAIYRHFASKQAVLAALLIDASRNLVHGGVAVEESSGDDSEALRGLIRFHVDFALAHADVIRTHDRDLTSLAADDSHEVRALQRRYVETWVRVLARRHPAVDTAVLRMRAHATFGLLNSTPHSGGRAVSRTTMRAELERMAWASLG